MHVKLEQSFSTSNISSCWVKADVKPHQLTFKRKDYKTVLTFIYFMTLRITLWTTIPSTADDGSLELLNTCMSRLNPLLSPFISPSTCPSFRIKLSELLFMKKFPHRMNCHQTQPGIFTHYTSNISSFLFPHTISISIFKTN